jgi:hypothetical protein
MEEQTSEGEISMAYQKKKSNFARLVQVVVIIMLAITLFGAFAMAFQVISAYF